MSAQIHPATLRALRKGRKMSQQKLADRSNVMKKGVGIATIKRIEASDDAKPYIATKAVADKLAKVLGVDVTDLAEPPPADNAENMRQASGYRKDELRMLLGQSTWLDFRMVEHRYGVSLRDQIEMAPLCMALLAESSLAWRRKRLAEIDRKAGELISLGGGNFAFAHAAQRALDLSAGEEESIRKRDIFGENVDEDTYNLGYDPNVNNPFADYLRKLDNDLFKASVQDGGAQPDLNIDTEEPLWPSGFPEFSIGLLELSELTNHDVYAKYAIAFGHARISEIPAELLGEGCVAERTEWLASHIPEAERKELEAELQRALEELREMFAIPAEVSSLKEERDNG